MTCRFAAASILIFGVILAGCSNDDSRPPREVAEEAMAEACAARSDGDVEAARDAADRAAKVADRINALLAGGEITAEQAEAITLITQATALEADLTDEEDQLADALSTWKAKSYRTARNGALKAIFKGLALAAEQADAKGLEALPESVRAAAEDAAAVSDCPPLPDGKPDWKGIAAEMNAWSAKPPPVFGLGLATIFLLGGRDDLALYEIEQVNAAELTNPDQRDVCHIVRGSLYRMRGLENLGNTEIKTGVSAGGIGEKYGPEFQSSLHLLMAGLAIQNGDYARADIEVSRAGKVYPNNPLTVFITGERLLADGQREKAADSLESAVASDAPEYAPLAKLLTERARQIRDEKGTAKPLINDGPFLARLGVAAMTIEAKRSPKVKKVLDTIDSTKAFGEKLLKKLPGFGD